ncbi:MAG: hypothetical protein DDT38_00649 [Firmicutes bacterium]|nr:hypothetical protein [candidate division NPL-UPA2 bacterium]
MFKFFAESDHIGVMHKVLPQQICQVEQQPPRCLGLSAAKGYHGVKGIKQEMGVYLCLQSPKLCAGQQLLLHIFLC